MKCACSEDDFAEFIDELVDILENASETFSPEKGGTHSLPPPMKEFEHHDENRERVEEMRRSPPRSIESEHRSRGLLSPSFSTVDSHPLQVCWCPRVDES